MPAAAFAEYRAEACEVDFLFVDDGSADRTGSVLARVVDARGGGDRVLRLPSNRGKGEAVQRGVLATLDRSPRYVGYWDADLATPLSAVEDLTLYLESRPELEGAIGARVRMLGRRIERSPWRHYPSRAFATLVSLALSLPVYDSQCGAKLFRASREIREVFERPFISRWLFDVEILARLRRKRRSSFSVPVHEVPLREWTHEAHSRLRSADVATAARDLFRIWLRYSRVS